MNDIISYKEQYYHVDDMYEYIAQCSIRDIAILSVEFFRLVNGKIIPFENLQSIDSTSLHDDAKNRAENAKVCNEFILSCFSRCEKQLDGLYFNATIDA